MIYALVRGWLSGMAATFVELILAATLILPEYSPAMSGYFAYSLFSLAVLATIEETFKCMALRGISAETTPFFRNSLFKGLLVGLGFSLFEIGLKILFRGNPDTETVLVGGISAGLLHITTGGILGAAWMARIRKNSLQIFWMTLIGAIVLHIVYNALLSPILSSAFS